MRFKKFDIQPNDRIHMTDEPKLTFNDNQYAIARLGQGVGKPTGLWYAIGRSWLEWMEREKMDWWRKYLYKIEIVPEKILFLDTTKKIKQFAKEYYRTGERAGPDWRMVSEKYSGVEFNPYFYNLRFEPNLSFYYGIAIPSGCIWDKAGIKNIVRIN